MGIFNFGRKEKNKANSRMTTVEFYRDCVEDFHRTAAAYGYVPKGIIFIPELIPLGEKAVLAYVQDDFFQMEFQDDPERYYYVINSLSFMTGVVYAAAWHEDYEHLKSGFDDRVIFEGAPVYANPILEKDLKMSHENANEFYLAIFNRWLKKLDPYWKLSDPRDYIFKATLASYQLGISMVLDKLGY